MYMLHIYIYIYRERERDYRCPSLREMGGDPRNPVPRNRFWVWVVKTSGCHCTDGHLTSKAFAEDQAIASSADPPEEHFPFL